MKLSTILPLTFTVILPPAFALPALHRGEGNILIGSWTETLTTYSSLPPGIVHATGSPTRVWYYIEGDSGPFAKHFSEPVIQPAAIKRSEAGPVKRDDVIMTVATPTPTPALTSSLEFAGTLAATYASSVESITIDASALPVVATDTTSAAVDATPTAVATDTSAVPPDTETLSTPTAVAIATDTSSLDTGNPANPANGGAVETGTQEAAPTAAEAQTTDTQVTNAQSTVAQATVTQATVTQATDTQETVTQAPATPTPPPTSIPKGNPPPGPTHPDTHLNCVSWYVARPGDGCDEVQSF